MSAEPTLYLFDGYNVLRAGRFADVRELQDRLADFVALRGVRGVLVLDGVGRDQTVGPLEVRYAQHADGLLERLAAEHREREHVCLVSSDAAVRGTSGQEVTKLTSKRFVDDLHDTRHRGPPPARLHDRLDPGTRERLERLRRGEDSPPA
ncbi:MAG: NYN domain-containing protein [Gaiellaceae bacterium]